MPERFLNYLRNERKRLDQELALVDDQPIPETGLLKDLRRLVDDQLARWTEDLSDEQLAA